MTMAVEIVIILVTLAVVSASMLRLRRQHALDTRADLICGTVTNPHDQQDYTPAWDVALLLWFERNGLMLDRGAIGALASVSTLPILITTPFLGWKAGLAIEISAIIVCLALILRRNKQRTRNFTQRLPEFLERVRRLTATGHTFTQAFVEATESADPLIKAHMDPVVRRFKHGMELAKCIDDLAHRNEIIDLHMLAAYVRANAKFGGRVSQTLASLIAQINNRHRLENEIKAATAETRASAIILFTLTICVIAVSSILNPDYIQFFLHTGTGHWILAGIIIWPLIGVLVMKRILALEF